MPFAHSPHTEGFWRLKRTRTEEPNFDLSLPDGPDHSASFRAIHGLLENYPTPLTRRANFTPPSSITALLGL